MLSFIRRGKKGKEKERRRRREKKIYGPISYICFLEEHHDGMHRVIPALDASHEDTVKVELEDGLGNLYKQFVRGGDVRQDGAGLHFNFLCLGQQICGVLHLIQNKHRNKKDGREGVVNIKTTPNPIYVKKKRKTRKKNPNPP